MPIGVEENFRGIVDLVTMQAITWDDESLGANYQVGEIPAKLQTEAAVLRDTLVEAAAEADEQLADKYLETGTLDEADLRKGIRQATLRLQMVPVLCGSAFKNKGVQPLLDAVVHYLPAPTDVPAIEGVHPDSAQLADYVS